MKAIFLSSKASAPALTYGNLPQPHVHDGDVLVKVHAAAITAQELAWSSTFHTRAGDPRPFPIVLGHQFSGVVEAIGASVDALKVGDAVFGINDRFSDGAQAEYCVAPAISMTRKPRLLDHVQASVLPLPALAAWLGLFEIARLQRDEHVLIHGATACIGLIAVQLARWRGARITATAPAGDQPLVRLLGADTVIEEPAASREAAVNDVDAVLDCVGSERLERSSASLMAGGRFATVASRCAGSGGRSVWEAPAWDRAPAAPLAQIGKLIDAGDIRAFVDAVFPLARAPQAYARSKRGAGIGGIAVRIVA
jgi:NADPH:quinone reductase-like Zn-dependent oxidoreductase